MTEQAGRLLFLESLSIIAGGQQCLLDLIKELRTRYEIVVVLPAEGPLSEALNNLGIAYRLLPVGGYSLLRKNVVDVANYALRFPWLTLALWRIIRQESIDLVYANSARTFLWGTLACVFARRPILWHLYSTLLDSKTIGLLNLFGRLPNVRKILSVCKSTSAPFPSLDAKIATSYVGVDTEIYAPHPDLGEEFRSELGVSGSTRLVGIVGNLIPLKGQDVFLKAASQVYAKISDVRFAIIGQARDGDAESQGFSDRLQQIARDSSLTGKVIFTGYYPDILKAINGLDLLVSSSRAEAMPLVILQAGACGKPVIASAIGGVPEIIQMGINGWLCQAGDDAELANAVVQALDDPIQLARTGDAARQITIEKFSLQRFVSRVEGQIENALSTHPRRLDSK
jgi:glycosyltransferase involved in cell wall biosynthesis